MTPSSSTTPHAHRPLITSPTEKTDPRRKFICVEESMRYSGVLQQLVFNNNPLLPPSPKVIEFGSGTGEPVVLALINADFWGTVSGYEINGDAVAEAQNLIDEFGLQNQYKVHHGSFYDAQDLATADCLIANPPYIPTKDRSLLTLPDLCGGEDGNDISKSLLSTGVENVLLLVSSYSDPVALLEHAHSLGYRVYDFQISKMPFGVYSRQDIVQERLTQMKREGKAFFTDNCYLVGGTFFSKNNSAKPDVSKEFIRCLTSLENCN